MKVCLVWIISRSSLSLPMRHLSEVFTRDFALQSLAHPLGGFPHAWSSALRVAGNLDWHPLVASPASCLASHRRMRISAQARHGAGKVPREATNASAGG